MSEGEEQRGVSRTDIVGYISGIFFTILGISYYSRGLAGFIGGLLVIFSGLLMIPITRPLILGTLGVFSSMLDGPDILNISRGVLLVVIFTGLVSGMIIAPPGDTSQDNAPASTQGTPTPTIVPTDTPTQTDQSTPQSTTVQTPTQTKVATNTPTSTPQPTQTDSEASLEEGVVVELISITDGDTMDVRLPDGTVETIRLLGVDTPETSVRQVTPDEWGMEDTTHSRDWLANWGDRSTNYAEERLSREIYIQTDLEADRRGYYGRLLVYAYQSESSETSFNYRLLDNGYARYYSSEFSKQSAFQSAESQAQRSDIGVWGYTAPDTPTETQSNSGFANLVVDGVHADADGNDHDNLNDEYIVLKNNGDSSLDIGGWTISDSADHTYTIPSGFTLDAGETVTIYTGSGSNSDSELYWDSSSAVWNNGGDTITVSTEGGETVVKYEY